MQKVIAHQVPLALRDMAARRNLHAGRDEAGQAWSSVHGQTLAEKLIAAWTWLFPGHSVAEIPPGLMRPAQLPCWAVTAGVVGVVVQLDPETHAPQIDWLGQPSPEPGAEVTYLVPITPPIAEDDSLRTPSRIGLASQAIRATIRDHMPLLFQVGFVTTFINLLAIVTSLFAMQVYDRVVPNFAYSTLWVLASGVALAYVFDVAFKLVRLSMLEASARRMDEALSLYFFEKVMALKVDRRPPRVGSLVAQIRDYESIKSFFTSSTLFVVADIPFVLFFIAVIGLIGGEVALVLVAFTVICLILGFSVYKPLARLQRDQSEQMVRKQGLLFEAVAGAEIIKSQGGESRFSDVWLRSARESNEKSTALQKLTSYVSFATSFCQQLCYVGVLVVGVYRIEAGELTMGGLIACAILSSRALGNISQISQLLLQWHHARHSLEVLNQLLDNPSDDTPGREANTHSETLDLTVGRFKYLYEGASAPQLIVPSLTIRAGERVAILGRNGSGKSTLMKALAGLATPSEGEVRIAGLDLQQCRPSWLRETIGYLPQDVRLISGTLLENLTLGLPIPEEEKIRRALERTGLLDAVKRHPQGLGLPIREGGSGLSGGQRQLVGFTRLLLQDPQVWLLDEPSASLDKESEERLITLVRSLPADHTVVFTTHRPNWLALATRVLIVEDGVIKADSPADKLKAVRVGPNNASAAVTASAS